jgi:hypothetical protein
VLRGAHHRLVSSQLTFARLAMSIYVCTAKAAVTLCTRLRRGIGRAAVSAAACIPDQQADAAGASYAGGAS